MTAVGVVGRKRDPQVKALAGAVRDLGARAEVVDFHNFPRFSLATVAHGAAALDDIHLPLPLDLTRLNVVHLRTVCFEEVVEPGDTPPAAAARVAKHYRRQRAKVATQLALLRALSRRIPVINHPDSFVFHRSKAVQQHLLERAGVPVPRSLTTADPKRAEAFCSACPRGAVAKPQASGAEVVMADDAFFRRWQATHPRRPYLFQRYVKGASVRAYLLGGRCHSAGVVVHDARHVDWRQRTRRVEPLSLDPAVERMLARATRLLNLPYCGIDLEVQPHDGSVQVLDLNPSALFVGWSRLRQVDLAADLARYLVDVARHGDDPWFACHGQTDEEDS